MIAVAACCLGRSDVSRDPAAPRSPATVNHVDATGAGSSHRPQIAHHNQILRGRDSRRSYGKARGLH
jgi:hypothetical protein